MHDKSLDILSINETRLDGSVDNNSIQLEGYNLVRKDRSREGGAVATYFRDHLNVKERAELIPDCIEAVCIEVIKIKSKPILVTTLYRPPNTQIEFFEKFECLITNLDKENKEFILVGDFNCDLLASDRLNDANRHLEMANLFQLKQLITEPTRVAALMQTLLDLFFTNKPENTINSGVVHLLIFMLLLGSEKLEVSVC